MAAFLCGNNLGIHGLAIDEQGRIWVGGYGEVGYFEKDTSGQLHYTSLLSQLPPEHRDQLDIWGVEVTSRGVVFSATNKIMRWDGKSFHIWPMSARLPPGVFPENRRHGLHRSIRTTGLWKLEGDEPVLVVPYDAVKKRPSLLPQTY